MKMGEVIYLCDEEGGNFDEEDKRRLDALANGGSEEQEQQYVNGHLKINDDPKSKTNQRKNTKEQENSSDSDERQCNGNSSPEKGKTNPLSFGL